MRFARTVVVDDDDAVRSIICALTKESVPGSKIKEHGSSFGALREVERGADLLITDCHMSGMDGIALVETIRRMKNSIPIIMASGDDDGRHLGEKAGIDKFVQKNRLIVELKDAIHTLQTF